MPATLCALFVLTSIDAQPITPFKLFKGGKSKGGTLLQGFDVITTPGEVVFLKAMLSRAVTSGRGEPLSRKKIYFSLAGQRLGQALTSETGIAGVKYTAPRAGDYRIGLTTSRRNATRITDASLLVRVIDSRAFVLMVDVEKVLHDSSSVRFPFVPNAELPSMPLAKETLGALAETRSLVYISSSDGSNIRKVKEWLALRRMPAAPVLCWDLPGSSEKASVRKTERIRALAGKFPNILGGIGNRRADAEALNKIGLAAYIISQTPIDKSELANLKVFTDWRGIMSRFSRSKRFKALP
ncbi:MAG: hypothetical protein QF473_30495 [Planctomycetota bacterium]|jgi:hypothetical protein|nr:hypothetical protein [Planctomycetota bacterium]MDP6503341.1 hypothetical protein [Planctomycetota bacterium]